MKKFRIVALAMCAVMLVALFAGCSNKNEKEIVFGTNAEFPPFEFVTKNGVIGEFDGIDMAIAGTGSD